MRTNSQPVRVLYVCGWVYSGSTLLANILGELEGFVSVGEVRHIWRRGFLEDRVCGCGAVFSECPFWQAVVSEAFGGVPGFDATRAAEIDDRLVWNRRFPNLLLARHGVGRAGYELREHARNIALLYRAIRSVSGCEVVVDTSKSPLYALVLDSVPDVDLCVAHLVRDARGAHCSRRRRTNPIGPLTGLLLYDVWHTVAELWLRRPGPYAHVRYEDFVRDPIRDVRRLARLAGVDGERLPFLDERRVTLRRNHNLAGNPNRFESGTIELRLDDSWRRDLDAWERTLAVALTWPLLLRHGYIGRG